MDNFERTKASEATLRVRCCVAGGGPAGVMLGFLLARLGVDVLVLEKHKDLFRDFRGDTIHPSTLDLMGELGLLDNFLLLPHQELREITAHFGEKLIASRISLTSRPDANLSLSCRSGIS